MASLTFYNLDDTITKYANYANSLKADPATAIQRTASTKTSTTAATPSATSSSSSDFRVRLSAQQDYVYGNGILSPLKETKGLLFPYTPSISVTQDVDYATMQMTHTNTDYLSYSRTPNVTVSIAAKFSAQSQSEGRYSLAALHFLRTVSKMHFGKLDTENAGLPPPVLLLNGYGQYMFNNIKVIIRNHSYSFEENMDMVKVDIGGSGGGSVRIPALFTVQMSLTVIQTPAKMREEFNLDDFRNGTLLKKGGWI